ncbi:MAG: hypothetical protein HY321_23005 [Armatimonadetes bacterium]|nr:hypothetical protein [Armatimonadota bacterium]
MDAYLKRHLDYCERSEREFDANPPPFVHRLRALKERQEKERRKAAA